MKNRISAEDRPPADPGLVREFWQFIRQEKKWWLLPILVSLALVALVTVIASSPAAPFIYTLF
ncbi:MULTISPECIES: DUF5989 family protein [Crateriforma]|nr:MULTISPECIES: DUF5989 family protein [Crateriforma]